jgi:Protein of unknown function (DUF669).
MAGNLSGFNAANIEVTDSYDPIPAGWYSVMITDSEFKATSAGTGQYLKLRFDVIEGEHQGRVIFTNLNLDNPNPKAVEIAQKDLAQICHAVGVMAPDDSTELHDKPLQAKVTIRPARDGYDAQNEVKGYRAMEGASAAPSAPAPAAGKKPWER